MSATTDQIQLGMSQTQSQNFKLLTGNDGTLTLKRNDNSQTILTVDASGKVSLPQGVANAGLPNLTIYTASVTPLPATNTLYSGTHSLGVIPSEAMLELTCITGEHNYVTGDVVQVMSSWNNIAMGQFCIFKNTTTVGNFFASGQYPCLTNKTTGAGASPTAANWSYRFKLRTS